MSTAGYVRLPSQLHTFTCEWTYHGEKQRHNFKYTGDVIDGYFACRENVIWSGHPSFRIVQLKSEIA
jgi:hypothetical protein